MSDVKESKMIPPKQETIITKASPAMIAALFESLTGAPDTKFRFFNKNVGIRTKDIEELHDLLIDKFRTHSIIPVTETVEIKISKQDVVIFNGVKTFVDENWRKVEETQEILYTMNFLVKLQGDSTPCPHTFTVRLCPPLDPIEMLKIMMSAAKHDKERLEFKTATCIAKVDFINLTLADELLDLAEKWFNTLPVHEPSGHWLTKLEPVDIWIARTIHWSFPFWISIASLFVLTRLFDSEVTNISSIDIITFGVWGILSAYGIVLSKNIGHFISKEVYSCPISNI